MATFKFGDSCQKWPLGEFCVVELAGTTLKDTNKLSDKVGKVLGNLIEKSYTAWPFITRVSQATFHTSLIHANRQYILKLKLLLFLPTINARYRQIYSVWLHFWSYLRLQRKHSIRFLVEDSSLAAPIKRWPIEEVRTKIIKSLVEH